MHKEISIAKIMTYLFIFIWIIFTICPLYWLLSCTFKPTSEALGYPPTLFPKNPTLNKF